MQYILNAGFAGGSIGGQRTGKQVSQVMIENIGVHVLWNVVEYSLC
jgi:hypothetical protein